MLPGFLGQVQRDFEAIVAGDFGEVATIADAERSVTLRVLFDEPSVLFDSDGQSQVLRPEPRITVAETATDFDLRRAGLPVTVRGKPYTTRRSDWEQDGLGQLTIYLDPVRP